MHIKKMMLTSIALAAFFSLSLQSTQSLAGNQIEIFGGHSVVKGKPGVVVKGFAQGLAPGTQLQAYIRFSGKGDYRNIGKPFTLGNDHVLRWEYQTNKAVDVSFAAVDATSWSNLLPVPKGGGDGSFCNFPFSCKFVRVFFTNLTGHVVNAFFHEPTDGRTDTEVVIPVGGKFTFDADHLRDLGDNDGIWLFMNLKFADAEARITVANVALVHPLVDMTLLPSNQNCKWDSADDERWAMWQGDLQYWWHRLPDTNYEEWEFIIGRPQTPHGDGCSDNLPVGSAPLPPTP